MENFRETRNPYKFASIVNCSENKLEKLKLKKLYWNIMNYFDYCAVL